MKSNIISSHVGIFVRRARKEKQMTGKQLAKLMNVSQQQISRYEIGITSITLDQLAEILKILDKKWIDVFRYIENETQNGEKNHKDSEYYWGRFIDL